MPEPERDFDELRAVVARKAGRLRNRRRLGLVSGAAALVAVLLVLASLPGGDPEPRRLQAADRPDGTSTTIDPSADDTIDPSEVYGEEPTTTVPGQTPVTTVKRKATTKAASPTTTVATPACGTPSVSLSQSETRAALVGAWMVCGGGPSVFMTNEAGIEVRADGRWVKLVRQPDGGLQRVSGWDDGGAWTAVQAQQVNFDIDGGGTFIAHASFTEDRGTVKLEHMGGRAHYVRVPSGMRISDRPPDGPHTAECARDEGPARRFSSSSELVSALTHVWLICGERSFFGTEAVGLEIRSNGRWAELHRRSDGALVRATGNRAGTWEVLDNSAMNGANSYQLNLTMDGSGTHIAHTTFATATTKMRLSAMGDHLADHVHAPAGTQVVDG